MSKRNDVKLVLQKKQNKKQVCSCSLKTVGDGYQVTLEFRYIGDI